MGNKTLTCIQQRVFSGCPHWGRGWTSLDLCPPDQSTAGEGGRLSGSSAGTCTPKDYRPVLTPMTALA